MELRRIGKTGVKTTCVCPYYINTGMFNGVKSRFSLLLPILQPEYVAAKMVDAILSNQSVLAMPRLVYLVPLMRALLPTSWFDTLGDVLGISTSMDDFIGRNGTPVVADAAGARPAQSS